VSAPITLFLVDDHDVVRRGLRAYINVVAEMEVIGEAASGEDALTHIDELVAVGTPPDVVLMDLLLPEMDGVATTAELLRRHPGLRIVVLTSFGGQHRVQAALEAGARGYLLKDADVDEIAAAVRATANGEILLDPAVAGETVGGRDGIDALTPREHEVLALLAAGCSNQQIANQLDITERTARTHVSNLLGKLKLGSRTQAALLAQREGIIPRHPRSSSDATCATAPPAEGRSAGQPAPAAGTLQPVQPAPPTTAVS
jgi:DNA-binding NarL/FixJ family response regulator